MKQTFFLAMAAAMIFTSACEHGDESKKPNLPEVPSAGTGDSGGGNSLQGRPLEAYLKDPRSLPAYQEKLEPVLRNLATFETMSPYLTSILVRKNWHFIPGPLALLPSERTGATIPTEQVALQDFDSVWIDIDLFSKMSAEDQARLLLHEVLLGIKLLKLESSSRICLFGLDLNIDGEGCRHLTTVRRGRPADLTAVDHGDVRRAVISLMGLPSGASREKIASVFYDGNFTFTDFEFDRAGHLMSSERLAMGEFLHRIREARLTDAVPRHLYLPGGLASDLSERPHPPLRESFDWRPVGQCELGDFHFVDGRLIGSLRLITVEGVRTITVDIPDRGEFALSTSDLYGRRAKSVSLLVSWRRAREGRYSIGDWSHEMKFFFQTGKLTDLVVSESVITEIYSAGSSADGSPLPIGTGAVSSPLMNKEILCSVRSSIRWPY